MRINLSEEVNQTKISKFHNIIISLNIDIKDDGEWPIIFQQISSGKTLEEKYIEWSELLDYFLQKENNTGHCHKGLIYWSLGVIDLKKGNIDNAITYLEKSAEDDKLKLNGKNQITASIGLLSIIKPLLNRFKDNKEKWVFDEAVKALYESLNQNEKSKFAQVLLGAHNNNAKGQIRIINDDFFTFITDDKIRNITINTYHEITNAVLTGTQTTYYSQIFALGSISEGILDELFKRNNQEIWTIFKSNPEATKNINTNSRMNSTDYPSGLTLNEKIWILREMINQNICPITKESVLLLIIIGEYRDLIHPRRRLTSEFEVTRYTASILLAAFSYIAGDWWPQNIKKIIEANYQLNN